MSIAHMIVEPVCGKMLLISEHINDKGRLSTSGTSIIANIA